MKYLCSGETMSWAWSYAETVGSTSTVILHSICFVSTNLLFKSCLIIIVPISATASLCWWWWLEPWWLSGTPSSKSFKLKRWCKAAKPGETVCERQPPLSQLSGVLWPSKLLPSIYVIQPNETVFHKATWMNLCHLLIKFTEIWCLPPV